jgi:hypothetical protein
VAGQPLDEAGVALGVVVDDFATEFAVGKAQGAVQLGFGNIDAEIEKGRGEPQMINLVNAGCWQAGPKRLFDLELRAGAAAAKSTARAWCPKGANGVQPPYLGCPPSVLSWGRMVNETNNLRYITESIIQGRNSGFIAYCPEC